MSDDTRRPPAALVTGGGRGIGRAVAAALTRAGWGVAVTGRSRSHLDSAVAAGDASLALPGDATSRVDVAAAVDRAQEVLGPLELVVANAGRFAAAGPVWESDPDEWWRDTEVNLRGPLLALHAALPGMVGRGSGRVVVLGSGIGTRGMPYASGYASSKAAVLRLVESVAGELEGSGVAVVAVSPGLVATDMTQFPEAFLARYPDWRDLAAREGVPAERVAALVLRIAAGELDELSGRFVHVRDDASVAAAAAATDPDRGTLRLVPWDPPQ